MWDFHILPSESIIKVMRSVITSSRRIKLVNRLGWLVIKSTDPDCPHPSLLIINCQPRLSQTWAEGPGLLPLNIEYLFSVNKLL